MENEKTKTRSLFPDFSHISLPQTARSEEYASVATHALGLAAGLVVAPWLLYEAWAVSSWPQWGSLLIFSLSLLLVYTVSTVYHAVRRPSAKRFFRLLEHISIFFLIAGTHTPFLVYYLDNSLGRFYLLLTWMLVGLGVLYKLFFFGRWEWVSLLMYLGMGWLGALTIPAMWEQLSDASLYGLLIGGLSYTVGVLFYAWTRLPYHHAVWHLFVIGGTAGHFVAVWYVV